MSTKTIEEVVLDERNYHWLSVRTGREAEELQTLYYFARDRGEQIIFRITVEERREPAEKDVT